MARGQKTCPSCKAVIGCRSKECPNCKHIFDSSSKPKEPKIIKQHTVAGKGRKTCPQCSTIVGVRTLACPKCGHIFKTSSKNAISVKTKEDHSSEITKTDADKNQENNKEKSSEEIQTSKKNISAKTGFKQELLEELNEEQGTVAAGREVVKLSKTEHAHRIIRAGRERAKFLYETSQLIHCWHHIDWDLVKLHFNDFE